MKHLVLVVALLAGCSNGDGTHKGPSHPETYSAQERVEAAAIFIFIAMVGVEAYATYQAKQNVE